MAGVSGSARLNAALGRPVYLTHGDGCRLYDVDGQTYLDYNLSHGASFLGHNHPGIRKAIQQALDMGVICAYETEHHSRVAETLCRLIPCAEQVRFANSGSEATFAALRVARAVTGRHKTPEVRGALPRPARCRGVERPRAGPGRLPDLSLRAAPGRVRRGPAPARPTSSS